MREKKSVLVTGAAKNLGFHISKGLEEAGFEVISHYRSEKPKIGIPIYGDFDTSDGVRQFIQEMKPYKLYGIINNVGPIILGSALDTKEEDWYRLFQVNLHAPFLIIKALATSSTQRIINIGVSGLSLDKGYVQSTAYTLSKLSLLSLTRSLAKELMDKMSVNMISPAYLPSSIEFPQKNKSTSYQAVIDCILYLFSEKGSSITGQNICI